MYLCAFVVVYFGCVFVGKCKLMCLPCFLWVCGVWVATEAAAGSSFLERIFALEVALYGSLESVVGEAALRASMWLCGLSVCVEGMVRVWG